MDVDDVPAALGSRPDRLSEVRPQEWAQRRTVQQIVDPVPLPTLDDPAPQMVGQLLNLAQFFDAPFPGPEQVIEVPKILSDDVPMRTPVREPQLVEQLVEVPTIVSWSLLQLISKQNVDVPVPGRGGRIAGLQGFLPGQSSSASSSSPAGVHGSADGPGEGFFRTFPHIKKKCEVGSAVRVGTECGLYCIHPGSSCGLVVGSGASCQVPAAL